MKLETFKNGERDMFIFDSMTDLTNFTDGNKYKQQGRASFIGEQGLDTWEQVEKRSNRVWAEGLYILQEFVAKLKNAKLPELKDKRRKVKFNNDDGDEVEYDRMMNGEDFYRKSERQDTDGVTDISVYIDTTTSAMKQSKDILWRGAAAIALTHILEERGYRVELWVVNGSKLYANKHTQVMTSCCLKRAGDVLDMSTLINTVSGWFYRTAIFTLLDTITAWRGEKTEYGFGSCYTPTETDLDQIQKDDHRIYSSGVFSFDGALSMIEAEIEKLIQS